MTATGHFVVCCVGRCNVLISLRSPWIIRDRWRPRRFGQHVIGHCAGHRFWFYMHLLEQVGFVAYASFTRPHSRRWMATRSQ